MYIGTFHSICLRIIKENLELTNLRKNYRTLEQFDQIYTIYSNISKFKNIENFELVVGLNASWKLAINIANFVNNLTEELVEPDALIADDDIKIKALGEIFKLYRQILVEQN